MQQPQQSSIAASLGRLRQWPMHRSRCWPSKVRQFVFPGTRLDGFCGCWNLSFATHAGLPWYCLAHLVTARAL
eukprot:4068331-Amphidinium_carterae.1